MKIISAANPRWADEAQTALDLDVEFEELGILPFTAKVDDSEPHGRALFASAVAGDFGVIAPYVAPPTPIPASVSMRQARLALLGAGLLQTVDAAVASMPGVEGDAARIEWEYALSVERGSPLVAGLSAALNLTTEQLDALFTTAAGL